MARPTRVLAISYSQTGQLDRIVRAMLAPLAVRDDVRIDWATVEPEPAFPFPWSFFRFLDAFPEAVHLDPPDVRIRGLDESADYDLIMLGYQVWFLAPSSPITGFLRSQQACVLRGKPVVTVVGCRNMWVNAHRTMGKLLAECGARHIDNVVLTDDGPLWSTFITTPLWLLTGNKGPLLGGALPAAGVAQTDIEATARFGRALVDSLPEIARGARAPLLAGLAAAKVNPLTMLGERIGSRSFHIWGRIVRLFGKPGALARKPVLAIYVVFLIGAIVCVLPITMTLAAIAARLSSKVNAAARDLEGPSGAGIERMQVYAAPPVEDARAFVEVART